MTTPNDGCSAVGELFHAFFQSAWDQFKNDEFAEANDMAKWLLEQPALGRYHKAGAHLILAHSPDCYVEHGREAVRLYKEMTPETDRQLRFKESCVAYAERVLKKAEDDYEECAKNPLSEEEYEEQWRKFSDHMDEVTGALENITDEEEKSGSSSGDATVEISDTKQALPEETAATSSTTRPDFELDTEPEK